MNKLVTTFIVLVLGFINAYSAYNVEIVDKYVNGTCKASFLITLDGDAGPFQVAMYDNDGNILYNESGLLNGLHTIPNIDMQSNLRIRISDAYGCGTQFDDLDFDCGCSNVVPTVEITHELCNTYGGAISISPIANMHAISLVWQDDNSTKLTRKDLSEGTYFAEFTFMPLTTQLGPLIPTAVSDYCTSILSFDVGPCECDEYNPIVEIKDATNGVDGEIYIQLEHGEEPIVYDWFQRETGLIFSGNYITDLSPGTYDVTITDSSCRGEPQVETYIVNYICNLEIISLPNRIETPTTCDGGDGFIAHINPDFFTDADNSLLIEGGTPPYEWNWKDLSNNNVLDTKYFELDGVFVYSLVENLKPGSYELIIIDSKGCRDSKKIDIGKYVTDIRMNTEYKTASCLGVSRTNY